MSTTEAVFPPADFVRRGPPVSIRDVERKKQEKWARVMVVLPRPEETAERVRYDFTQKGPFTLPLASLRSDIDAGDKNAWQFFTHPYSVFPQDSCFYNVSGKGCLGARLFVRAPEGVRIYDEVGANLDRSEFVSESFPGALGVLRNRVLGGTPEESFESPFLVDLLELDVDLLELFYLSTLLLKGNQSQKALERIDAQLQRTTLHLFAHDLFTEDEHELMQRVRAGDADEAAFAQLGVRDLDLVQVTDVVDPQGKQIVSELAREYEAFEAQHKDLLTELSLKIHERDHELEVIKGKVKALQQAKQDDKAKRGISGMFKRATLFGKSKTEQINELKAEAVKAIRAKREHERAMEEIPGYERVRGLTERVQGFTSSVQTIQDMARNIVDHNVTRAQLNGLRSLVREKVGGMDEEEGRRALRTYTLRLRAEILPRVLASYELSAYVLRRPDAIRRSSRSSKNVARINNMARSLIEYFRYMRFGNKDLGDAYDSGWGQVVQLEARL
ncbi:MAG: hypothetical protein AB7N76_27870 [Planctomycetota bacterium]